MPKIETVRRFCVGLPHVTEHVQWGNNLVFKVGGKMFAVLALEPSKVWLSFKSGNGEFEELCERPGIIPAPYLARAQWVGLQDEAEVPAPELRERLRRAYDLVVAGLPAKARAALG